LYATTISCLRLAALEGIEESPIQCQLLPGAVDCLNCKAYSPETIQENQLSTPIVNAAYIAKMKQQQELYYKLFDVLIGDSLWERNCIFCFLVSRLIDKSDSQEFCSHSSIECVNPQVITRSSCYNCFGTTLHRGSLFCSNALFSKIPGLCRYCWLPMKLGQHWIHKDESLFGSNECSHPKWIGRLLYILQKRIKTQFKVEADMSKQEYADWLAMESLEKDANGEPNAVHALMFALDFCDDLMKK
jgi:hypothetical protein